MLLLITSPSQRRPLQEEEEEEASTHRRKFQSGRTGIVRGSLCVGDHFHLLRRRRRLPVEKQLSSQLRRRDGATMESTRCYGVSSALLHCPKDTRRTEQKRSRRRPPRHNSRVARAKSDHQQQQRRGSQRAVVSPGKRRVSSSSSYCPTVAAQQDLFTWTKKNDAVIFKK